MHAPVVPKLVCCKFCDIPIQHLIGLNSECQSYSNAFLVCLRSIYFAEAGAIASLVQFWHSLSLSVVFKCVL